MEVSLKIKNKVIIRAGNSTLGIYPEKTVIQKDTCTSVFMVVLFTIAKTWKKPKCPSIGEQMKNTMYIYAMEYLFSHK